MNNQPINKTAQSEIEQVENRLTRWRLELLELTHEYGATCNRRAFAAKMEVANKVTLAEKWLSEQRVKETVEKAS